MHRLIQNSKFNYNEELFKLMLPLKVCVQNPSHFSLILLEVCTFLKMKSDFSPSVQSLDIKNTIKNTNFKYLQLVGTEYILKTFCFKLYLKYKFKFPILGIIFRSIKLQ